MNPGSLAPEARIIPLDQAATAVSNLLWGQPNNLALLVNLQIFNLTLSRMNNGGIGFVKKPPSERNGRSRFSGSVVQTQKINDKARSLDARFGIALCPLKTDSISASAKLRGYPADLASWIGPPVLGGFIAKADPPRTRTWNLRLRRPTPYPLGQRAMRMTM